MSPAEAPVAASLAGAAVDHVGLSVGDLDGSSAFYRALGFVEVARTAIPSAGSRVVVLALAGGPRIELTERAGSTATDAVPSPAEAALRRGYFHWAIAVPDLERAYAAAVACGAVAIIPPRDGSRPGMRFAYVADPEGNLLELTAAH